MEKQIPKSFETIVIDAGIDFDSYNPDLDDFKIRNELNIAENDIVLFFMGWIYDFAGMKELAIELGKRKNEYPTHKTAHSQAPTHKPKLQLAKELFFCQRTHG